MATTLATFAGTTRGNYCTLPQIDVEILTGPALCKTCGTPLTYDARGGSWGSGGWVHETEPEQAHYASPVTRCRYCGTQDPAEVTYVQAAWSDEVRCTRCGGTNGFAIGD